MSSGLDPLPSRATGANVPVSPTRGLQLANLAISQAAWFATVLSAAHHVPIWGLICVVAAIAWHLKLARRWRYEACLVIFACLLGFVIESTHALLGHVSYPSGQPDLRLAPYWMVALWGLFAIALNVNLRWLRGRWWLAASLGAAGGPAAFSSGVSLGAAAFVDSSSALTAIAISWAIALPLLVRVSEAFDGVIPSEEEQQG